MCQQVLVLGHEMTGGGFQFSGIIRCYQVSVSTSFSYWTDTSVVLLSVFSVHISFIVVELVVMVVIIYDHS